MPSYNRPVFSTASTGVDASYTGRSQPKSVDEPMTERMNPDVFAQAVTSPTNPNTWTPVPDKPTGDIRMSPPPDVFMPKQAPGELTYTPSFMETLFPDVHGTHPLQVKAALLQMQEQQLSIQKGWQAAQISMNVEQRSAQRHEVEMNNTAMEQMPNDRAVWLQMPPGPDRDQFATMTDRRYNKMSADAGSLWKNFTDNPLAHLSRNYHISQNQELQALWQTHGAKLYDMGMYKDQAKIDGHDALVGVMGFFTADQKKKLASGKMKDGEISEAFKSAGLGATGHAPMDPQVMQIGLTYMATPDGQAELAGFGVQTNTMASARAKKLAQMSAMDAHKDEDFVSINSQLNDQAQVSQMTKEQHADLERRRDVYLGQSAAPKMSTSHTINNDYLMADPANQGRYSSTEQLHGALGNGTARPGDLEMLQRALATRAAANPSATAGVARAQPVDTSKDYVFDRKSMLEGRPKRWFGNVSDQELRTGGEYVRIHPDQYKILTTLEQTGEAADMILGQADRLYKGVGVRGSLAQGAKSIGAQIPGIQALLPELTAYQQGLAASATTFARSLGMEVGVLTDTDVNRWVSMLPSGADTAEIAKIKIGKFRKMYDYVKSVNGRMMAGELPMGDKYNPYMDKKHRSKVEGIFGEYEDSVKKLEPGKESKAEKPKLSAAQRLSEAMHAQDKQ